MTRRNEITIIGGGLAGLTLGIGLRQHDVPVIIREAATYPRHRVCGEFISGRGLQTLQRLGLLETLMKSEVRFARTAALFYSGRRLAVRDFPVAALCVARFTLDALLADTFCRHGGRLCCEARWPRALCLQGMVRASGRRAETNTNKWRAYGLKAHAKNILLQADIEMHFGPHHYVGLCRLPHGKVNVCGFFLRSHRELPLPRDCAARLYVEASSDFANRLKYADWDEDSFCAVGGLPIRPGIPRNGGECRVGDAFAMIPPFTGNGMSMAFESAELALKPLCHYAAGHLSWEAACRSIEKVSRQAFNRRLLWSGWLHTWLLHSSASRILPKLATVDPLWRLLFWITR